MRQPDSCSLSCGAICQTTLSRSAAINHVNFDPTAAREISDDYQSAQEEACVYCTIHVWCCCWPASSCSILNHNILDAPEFRSGFFFFCVYKQKADREEVLGRAGTLTQSLKTTRLYTILYTALHIYI